MRTATALLLAAGLLASPAAAAPFKLTDAQLGAITGGALLRVSVFNQASDQPGVAAVTDPNLVNAWGLSMGPATALWVANNGTGTSTLYSEATNPFTKLGLVVTVPGPGPTTLGSGVGAPTGTTFVALPNPNQPITFPVTEAGRVGTTVFAFATEDGLITGWNPTVDPTHSLIAVNNSARGDNYKGLTLAGEGAATRMFAADFANGVVRMFNNAYQEVGAFTDPGLPSDFAPFNVQTLNGQVYVTFAKQGGEGGDELHGQNLGYVSVFDQNGNFLRRLVSRQHLDAPWGLAIAPQSFGKLAGALLIGNFGDGTIIAVDPQTGNFMGEVRDSDNKLSIDGLWALRTGPNGTIVFSAGPDEESHGLLGTLSPIDSKAHWSSAEVVSAAELHR